MTSIRLKVGEIEVTLTLDWVMSAKPPSHPESDFQALAKAGKEIIVKIIEVKQKQEKP
jgi:hypothetical protein